MRAVGQLCDPRYHLDDLVGIRTPLNKEIDRQSDNPLHLLHLDNSIYEGEISLVFYNKNIFKKDMTTG